MATDLGTDDRCSLVNGQPEKWWRMGSAVQHAAAADRLRRRNHSNFSSL